MKTERNEKILDRVQEWIKSVDQKVSIFLAFQGVVIALLIPKIQLSPFLNFKNPYYTPLGVILYMTSLLLLIFSCYKSISVIIPRLFKIGTQSITYFGDIASMRLSEYKKLLNKTNETEYQDELINQIHISAIIAKNKHEQFREAVILFCIGIILLLIQLLILF